MRNRLPRDGPRRDDRPPPYVRGRRSPLPRASMQEYSPPSMVSALPRQAVVIPDRYSEILRLWYGIVDAPESSTPGSSTPALSRKDGYLLEWMIGMHSGAARDLSQTGLSATLVSQALSMFNKLLADSPMYSLQMPVCTMPTSP